jgi:hypothetical protein
MLLSVNILKLLFSCVQGKKLTGDVKGAVDVMEERLTEVKVMKQMELTETTRKLGKCIVVKVMKQMELTETTRKLGKRILVKVMKQM